MSVAKDLTISFHLGPKKVYNYLRGGYLHPFKKKSPLEKSPSD